jgi:hypothetical protein
MTSSCRLLVSIGLACALPAAAGARTQNGDHDDQFVVTGCVAPATHLRTAGPPSLFVWSRGDVYLAYPDVRFRPTQTPNAAGVFVPVFYWIDDEDDIARHVGQRVEVVGELSDDLDEGSIDIEHEGAFTKVEFDVNGHEAKARIPRSWLGPAIGSSDAEFDVVVRTVDVEKVTVLGSCADR